MKSVFNRGIAVLGLAGFIGAGIVAAQLPSNAQTSVTTTPGGKEIVQKPHSTTVFHPGGKIVKHRANGSKTTWHKNGTVVTRHPNGTTVVHHANGTVVVHKKGMMGGRTTTVFKNGTVTTHHHM